MEFDGGLTRTEAEAAATELLTATQLRPGLPTQYEQRRDRLLRWGWPEPEAEALAAKLTGAVQMAGSINACVECQHYRPGRCARYRAALLSSPEVGRALSSIHQNCPAFARLEAHP